MNSDNIICRVLIVDDDNDLCELMTMILQKNGPVHVEHTLREAESRVKDIDPMIVFLDNNLPDGLGVQHIRPIQAMCPEAKIILMTADTTPNLQANALREGAALFVAKPFSLEMLRNIVYSVCPPGSAA